jgi:hypothetical protein
MGCACSSPQRPGRVHLAPAGGAPPCAPAAAPASASSPAAVAGPPAAAAGAAAAQSPPPAEPPPPPPPPPPPLGISFNAARGFGADAGPMSMASGAARVSRARLARHGADAAEPWLAVHGTVYALRTTGGADFAATHPGGSVILTECGRDATAAFVLSHARVKPDLWLRRVGALEDD